MINLFKLFKGQKTVVEVLEKDTVHFKTTYSAIKSKSPDHIIYKMRGVFHANENGVNSFRVVDGEQYKLAQSPGERAKEIDEFEPESRKDTLYGDTKLLFKKFGRNIGHYQGFTRDLLLERLRSIIVSGNFPDTLDKRIVNSFFIKKYGDGGYTRLSGTLIENRSTYDGYLKERGRVTIVWAVAFLVALAIFYQLAIKPYV
jgi:hypothetical protein